MSKVEFQGDEPVYEWAYETKPQGYARPRRARPTGPGPIRWVLAVGRADRRLAGDHPDPQTPDITGRYQNDVAAGLLDRGASWLLHVNQAGQHIEGMFVDLSGTSALFYRFGGDLSGDEFSIAVPDGGPRGHLRIDGKDVIADIVLPRPLVAVRFHLRDKRPTFLEGALESAVEIFEAIGGPSPAGKQAVENAERAPLTNGQMRRLRDKLDHDVIEEFLKKYNDHASTSDVSTEQFWRVKFTDDLDSYIGTVLSPTEWPREQLGAVREYARTVLGGQSSRLGKSMKSQLQWIEDMTSSSSASENAVHRPLTNLHELTGIPVNVGQVHEYTIELKLKSKDTKVKGGEMLEGLPLKLNTFRGTIEITKQGRRGWGPEVFPIVIGGLGILLGKGKGADLEAKSSVTTYDDWIPADFPGLVTLLDGGVWLGKKVQDHKIGKEFRDPVLILEGRGNHPKLRISIGRGFDGFREGAGGEFSLNWGWIIDWDKNLDEIDFSRKREKAEYTINKKAEDEIHFEFGSALLAGRGRQRIRQTAAVWLPWLTYPLSTMKMVGHADTVDTPERNRELSLLRAENTKQAFIDILGKKLAIPRDRDHMTAEGRGEEEAAHHGPDNTRNLKFRRVNIYLNGICILVLWRA